MDYAEQKIYQLQKQYEMLMMSIVFSSDSEKNNIFYELNKIVNNILKESEIIYNQKYDEITNIKTSLLKEEKEKLVKIIELVENRRRYVMDIVDSHRRNVDINFEIPEIKGLDRISDFQRKIKIIDKYSQNIKLKNKLVKEIDDLSDKLSKSEVKIRANDKVNKELEAKLKEMLEKSFKAMEIYSYKEREEEIELAFNELSFAKEKAVQNINIAKSTNNSILLVECEKMFDSIEEEYRKYFEKKMLLKLLYMYDRVVNNYDELLLKREEINEILSQIDSSDFYKLVFNEVNKQYNTIKLEQQDVKTYNSLFEEKDTKERLLIEIEKENSSDEFVSVLDELLKNEKIKQDKEEQERRKEEYEERQKKLIEESKKQEEIRKRQKIIEDERKRDIEIRTREMLEKQKTGVIPKVEVKEENEDKEKDENRDKFVDSILSQMEQDEVKNKEDSIPFFPVKEDKNKEKHEIKNEQIDRIEVKEKPKKIYDDILKDDNEELKIPVIKNDKLVAKKVDENKENNVDEFMKKFLEDSKKEEVKEFNDMVFPDMPM